MTLSNHGYIKKAPREFTISFLTVGDKVFEATICESYIPRNGEFTEDNKYYPGQLIVRSYIRDGLTTHMNVAGFKGSDVRIYNKSGEARKSTLYKIALELSKNGMVTIAGEIK